MIIDLRIDIIALNLSYFMLYDDCQIATYVYILWDYLYNDNRGNKVLTGISNSLKSIIMSRIGMSRIVCIPIKAIKYASIIFNSLRNTISNSFLFNIVIILFDETMTVSHSWLTFDYFTLVNF